MAVSPLTAPQRQGYNLYLPLPFSRSCKITLSNDALIITPEQRTPSIYYNIGARIYDRGTRVVTLKREMLSDDSLAIDECRKIITGGSGQKQRETDTDFLSGTYSPGSACRLTFNDTGKAITEISLRLHANDDSAALRTTRIKISFDSIERVNLPVRGFFGTGFHLKPYNTLHSSIDSAGTLTFSFVMPFREMSEVCIVNEGTDSLGIEAKVTTSSYTWDSSSMYFSASWKEYSGIETAGAENNGGTGLHRDLTYVCITRKGVYAGDAITVSNTADAWWGEGDEKIYVDGETFPSSFGTGTEDYYGYAWCRPEPFSHPFISQPSGDGNFHPGVSVNMRYRGLDAIPFRETIKTDIELWHWVKTTIDYSLTSYYYVTP
jgi:hypothetical protein